MGVQPRAKAQRMGECGSSEPAGGITILRTPAGPPSPANNPPTGKISRVESEPWITEEVPQEW